MSALHAPHLPPALLRSLGDGDVAVLRLLLREAEKGRGWFRRCRRGWRFAEEITAMGQHAGRLPWLAERGLLDRLDEREEGRRTPHWLYRVTNLGAAVVALRTGSEFGTVPRPARKRSRRDAGRFFAPAAPLGALGALVSLRGDETERAKAGWATTAELRSIVGTLVDPGDLAWLVERGYAERREVGRGKQIRAAHRATERGTRLRIVDGSATLRRRAARFVMVVEDHPDPAPDGYGGGRLEGVRPTGSIHLDLSGKDSELLAFLRDEAVAGHGWERRGQRGWRFAHELRAEDVPRWGLPGLYAAGLLDRIDERAPEQRRPLYLYRITDGGARWLAERRGEPHQPIEAPGDDLADRESFFAPHRSIAALRVLVGAGKAVWLNRLEIATRAGLVTIEESDLAWLAEHRYAWKRERSTPQRRPVYEYAATACGRLLRVVAEDGIAFGRLSYVLVALGDGDGS